MITKIIPLLIGLATVVQGGLNRRIAQDTGLAGAILLNSTVVLLGSMILAAIYASPVALPAWRLQLSWASLFRPGYLLAGLCGLLIVAGIPWSIGRQGAALTFIVIVAAQLAGALLWDVLLENQAFSPWRVAGTALAILGAVLASVGGRAAQ